jgi:hypothetical protein
MTDSGLVEELRELSSTNCCFKLIIKKVQYQLILFYKSAVYCLLIVNYLIFCSRINLINMKKRFYFFNFFILLFAGIQVTFAQTTNVTQDFTADPEWDGIGNTGNTAPNYTDFGYRNIEGVTGVKEGDFGCIGGVFCRNEAYSYYADTDLNGILDQTMTLKVAGSMKLENRTNTSFDGAFGIGYFDATNPNWNTFLGVQIKEPMTAADAFRGVAGFNFADASTTKSADVPITQLEKIDFDLTFTGSADGSGTISGKLAGQDINVTVPAGTGTFNSFGLFNGGFGNNAQRTRNCYFDDLTYSKIGPSSVVQNSTDMIRVYPNVTSDRINFNNLPENSKIELVDMVGRTLAVKTAAELNGGMSLQSYANGLYLIRILQGQEYIQSTKILKN